MMNTRILDDLQHARIIVAITFHFSPGRVKYLAHVVRLLSEFAVGSLSVKIFTNTDAASELATLSALGAQYDTFDRFDLEIRQGLRHPFELTWSHKEIIAKEFGEGSAEHYTHFIYLEDDIGLNFRNFIYFCEYRPVLAEYGLVPSFARVEYRSASNGFVNTDIGTPFHLNQYPSLDMGDVVFVALPNPFCACFILDRTLALEHIQSRSFHVDESIAVIDWDVRERAAMGQCFEVRPAPFAARYVVPVVRQSRLIQSCAWLSHIANNYADDETTPFAKVRMEELIL